MVAGVVGVMVGLVSVMVPAHAVVPSKASKATELSVTLAVPLIIFGFRIPVTAFGTIRSSGLRYHSEAGLLVWVPLITSSVMLLAGKVCVLLHEAEAVEVIAPGLVEATVYDLKEEALKLFRLKTTSALLPASLFSTMIVIVVPVASSAA